MLERVQWDERLCVTTSSSLGLRGVLASAPIRCNTALITVPKSACINAITSASDVPRNLASDGSGIDFAASSLCELRLGPHSSWSDYLQLCSSSSPMCIGPLPSLPLHWYDDDFALLTGTDAHVLELNQLQRDAERTVVPFLGSANDHTIVNEFVRAAALVWSRAFGNVGLVPGVDLLNHSSESNAHVINTSDQSIDSEAVTVLASRDIDAGEEIFLTYANGAGNDLLLRRFGFVECDNPNSVVTISDELLHDVLDEDEDEDDSNYDHDEKKEQSETDDGEIKYCHSDGGDQHASGRDRYGPLFVSTEGEISNGVVRALFGKRVNFTGGSEGTGREVKSIDEPDENGLKALIALLQARLSRYAGGKAEDDLNEAERESQAAAGKGASSFYTERAAALRLRGEEKRALERAFEKVVAHVKRLRSAGRLAKKQKNSRDG